VRRVIEPPSEVRRIIFAEGEREEEWTLRERSERGSGQGEGQRVAVRREGGKRAD